MKPLSRREFGLFGWTAAIPAGFPVAGLAIGTYGMKALPTDEALLTIARIGYDGVELALMPGWPADPARLTADGRKNIRESLERYGLVLPALNESLPLTGAPPNRTYNLERLKLAAEMAHGLSPSRPPCIDTILGLKTSDWEKVKGRMVDELHEWARVARSNAITIGIKPHAGHALDTPAKSIWVMRQLRSPHIRLIYDYSHMFVGGFGLEQSLREMLPYTVFISLKDSKGAPEKHEYLLPGDGATDYVSYFRLLRHFGYRGFVSVEVSSMIQRKPGYDPVATARLCYSRLAPLFAKAGLERHRR